MPYHVTEEEIPKAGAVLAEAFSRDPLWNRVFEKFPRLNVEPAVFYETPVRICLRFGHVWASSPALEGVMAWVPAEKSKVTFLRALRSGALRLFLRIGPEAGRAMGRIFNPMERDRLEYTAGLPCHYLQILGVGPDHQGQGHGGALLRALIDECEVSHRHLYLETETESNVALYEKFGFRVVKKITLPIVELPMWEMDRAPS